MGIQIQYLEKNEFNNLAINQKQEKNDCIYYRKNCCKAIDQNRPICKICPHYIETKEEINTKKFFARIIGIALLFLKSFGGVSAGGGGQGAGGGGSAGFGGGK